LNILGFFAPKSQSRWVFVTGYFDRCLFLAFHKTSAKKKCTAEFPFCVWHDCLGTHLHRNAIRPDPYCMLCSLCEPMDRNHLGQCTAVFNGTQCERYWEARTKWWKTDLSSFLLIFLWLLLTIRTFIFTLNAFYSTYSVYSVILIFYYYWWHRSVINNQGTCYSFIHSFIH